MADITYTIILREQGIKAFTMPQGYWPDVEIHCWGAGGGKGRGANPGGGGGYAKATANIYEGDEVTLQIGQPGTNGGYPAGGVGGVDPSYRLFRGGNSSSAYDEDADTGAGGGGGGASWVAVNGIMACCGAGGGGASGYGEDNSGRQAGLPGGVTTNGLNTDTRGGDAPAGWAPGGGGGGGYPYGGKAGYSVGDDNYSGPAAGSGGQNYGNVTVAGSGSLPGGRTVSYYPGNHVGEQNYPGYVVMVLRKKLQAFIKNADGGGNWSNIAAVYTKTPSKNVTISTTNTIVNDVSAYPTSLNNLITYLNGIIQGNEPSQIENAWYVISPPLTQPEFEGTPYHNVSTVLMRNGEDVSRSTATTVTSFTVTDTTYTRQSLAYSGALGVLLPSGWANVTVSTYNYKASTTSTIPTVVSTISGGWKQIQQAFTKVNGLWKPILTNRTIELYNYPGRRQTANIALIADTNDYILYDHLPGLYFEGLMDVNVWVYPNVTIRGETTSTAFTISGFSNGDTVTLNNYGRIQGRGGAGGNGSYRYTYSSGKNSYSATAAATAGGAGGTGLLLQYQTTVINAGNIAGGGGGGGGGAIVGYTTGTGKSQSTSYTGGGGGGGGAGFGVGGSPSGSSGTLTAGGAGSTYGGTGGSRGQPGNSGSSGGAAGGAAGYAIQGALLLTPSSNIGNVVTGTIVGPISA